MARRFKRVDYEQSGQQVVTLSECLPSDHLVYFVVKTIAQLDLSAIYAHYTPVGGEAYAPEVLLGLLVYGYATGVFSSRKIEKGTHETLSFRYIAGGGILTTIRLPTFEKSFCHRSGVCLCKCW
jgi:transposase